MKKSKKVMALVLALSMVMASGMLAFADVDSVPASEPGDTVQTADQESEHAHNPITEDQACAACNGTGEVTTTETVQTGSDAEGNPETETKETACTTCGGDGKIEIKKSCSGEFVKVAEKSVAPTTEAEGYDYYECATCGANYREAVAKLETPKPCENPNHDQKKNVHKTCITFYDENGNLLKTSGAFTGYKYFGVPEKNLYDTATFVDAENMSHYFDGWYDEAGNKYIGTQKYVASETECQDIKVYPRWDVEAHCENPVHNWANNNNYHRHSIVGIDQNEDGFHNKWSKPYGRYSGNAKDKVTKSNIQAFTSGVPTHNNGIYYYEFLGWYTEDGKCIATQENWNETKKRYDFTEPITMLPSKECEEVKIYAKWKEHHAPILQFNVIDKVTTFGMSFSNKESVKIQEGETIIHKGGRITSFGHKFSDPRIKNPEQAKGYQFLGFVEVDESGNQGEKIYQPDETYHIDMTDKEKFPDDSVTVKNIYAMWQPSVTVNYKVDDNTIKTTGEMYNDYNVVANAPADPSKEGYDFVGWVDEEGKEINEVKALGIITTGEKVKPKVVNVYAKFEKKYTVSYNLAGGNIDGKTVIDPVAYKMNDEVTVQSNPVRSGYNFKGWTVTVDNGQAAPAIENGKFTMPAANVTLTANWEAVPYIPPYNPPKEDPQPLPPDDPLEDPDKPSVEPQPLPPDDPLIEDEDPKQPLPDDEHLIDPTDAEKPADPDQPKTGDEAPLMALGGLFFAAAGALGVIYIRRRTDR